jgi:hypothetical protein
MRVLCPLLSKDMTSKTSVEVPSPEVSRNSSATSLPTMATRSSSVRLGLVRTLANWARMASRPT